MERTGVAWVLVCVALVGCPEVDAGNDTLGDLTAGATTGGVSEAGSDPSQSATTPTPAESSSGEEMTTGETTTGDNSVCGATRACLDKPPLGWTGPVAVAKSGDVEMLPACADPYPGNDLTRLEGYTDPPATECECSCGLDAASCNPSLWVGTTTSCFSMNHQGIDGCFPVEVAAGGAVYATAFPQGGAAACDQVAVENVPDIPWEAVAKGCTGGASDDVCEGEDRVCYPKPAEAFEQEVCFIAQGDIPCPPDTDYQEKTIRYSAVEDTRECSSCQCGAPSGCLETYEYFASADCSGAAAGSVPNAVCTPATMSSISFDFTDAACPIISGGEAEGEVTPLDPWTYCCAGV